MYAGSLGSCCEDNEMMKVLCAHNWTMPMEGWDKDRRIIFQQCRWCKCVWFEGDAIPQTIIGTIVDNGMDKPAKKD